MPARLIQRRAPLTSSPMTSTDSSSKMLTPYSSHANRYQTKAGIRLKKYMATSPMAAQTACFCKYLVEISYPVSYSLWA